MTAPPTAPDTTVTAAPVSAPPAATAPARPISAPPAATAPVSAPPAATASAPVSAPPAATAPAAPVSAPPATTASAPVSAPPAATAPAAPVSAPNPAEQGDPEQVLAGYRWRIDPETLREIVDDPDELQIVRRRLTEKLGTAVDNRARARLLSLRAVVSRVLGELDDALADARLALTYAEATGELRRIALAQARLGQVLRWRGEFVEADQLFARATSPELPDRLRAALHEHAGRSCVDQGRFMEACLHFERALDLRGAGDADLLDRVRTALDAIAERAAEGLGPYPRSRDEVLERIQPPVPARDGALWGYTDPEGELVVPARYAETQQFREGLAWVRRPETDRWSLIALTGTTVIEPSYLAVRPFSDGLAWVVRNAAEGWLAVDPTGDVVIPPGFADVRPFRRGVAAVRREGWGAVDRTGQIVVPTRYHSFRTALADGRYVDGFTDEGLAVIELGGRHGVVDHTGAVLVPPVHPALVVHPVAFLVGTGAGRWGALDRRGNPLIDPAHRTQEEVLEEIERLLADTNPVL
ncbi:WG repeat-containing protein [Micromonospora musae]|uniref:WG repeat-containing protein n=1 Tax=Micromonospora musae TaxID=1894970 RepID=UPI001F2E8262|nr:WG repeat-containing protein [Micromonospora musae]